MNHSTGALPLLFLDVDGPLIPFGAPTPYPTFEPEGENPFLPRIDPALGPRLRSLPCELVWATAWTSDANDLVAPRLGLPRLPVVHWPKPSDQDDLDEQAGLHWKTRHLLTWAAGRPFAWVDDELTETDRAWVAAHHSGPALLHHVDSARGLADADFTALTHWLRRT
ncbi:HAD domain-containing protein [Spirillospora sp. NPDC052269]